MTDTSDFGTFGRFTETPVEDGIVRPAQVLRIEFSDSGAPFGHLASAGPTRRRISKRYRQEEMWPWQISLGPMTQLTRTWTLNHR
jgi:hypothetical protein